MPVNIFIADDQKLVRQGIRCLLEEKCDVQVVGEATNGFECLNEVSKLNPNIVILDINMSGMDGINTLKIMKEQGFSAKTLMLAENESSDDILSAVDLGCDGYIDTLFNLHEWIALACYEAIEVSYAALIWFLFLAMGDLEVVIAE